MEAILWVVGTVALLWLAYWYFEDYTPRKHMREAIADADAIMGKYYPRPAPQLGELDVPLPCDVRVGHTTFRKGVKLNTFIEAARRWHREAFPDGYLLTPEQKTENLAALQSCRPLPHPGRQTVANLRGQLAVAVDLLRECIGPLEVSAAVIESDDTEQMETLIDQVRKFCADASAIGGATPTPAPGSADNAAPIK
jgi:hypothetical protein